ncbi:hypothetical protein J4G43_044685 [Bradyrhizobium barranii subsp. barranii]|uniref:Type III effector NopAB n=1 Tax=Bradyrhizobium barranii subsp. barranii TaxID=2823807 RepID=A0A9X9XV27_9BRAD|nr:hypothetical protein [Bradyrhizobium barranii]UEM11521.1 hypothetical protein J4G43_044685 [Bradyrhizobium barranii subsp. barranii]
MQPRVCLSSSTFVSFSKASLSNTRTWPLDDEAAHAGIRDELQLIPSGRSSRGLWSLNKKEGFMAPSPIDNARSPESPTAHVWTQEDHDLFSEIMNEAGPSSSAAPEEAVDVSFAAPQRFSHGSQIAPDSMVDRLFHRGLLPDSDQPTMTYEIQGHRYTAGLDECNRVLLVHNPAEDQVLGAGRAGVPDFGAFFAENRRYGRPLPQQWATPALIDKLREEGFMPTANSPTTIHLNGRAYKAELAEGGFVKLTRV